MEKDTEKGSIREILIARKKVHGDFSVQAQMSQRLKRRFRIEGGDSLPDTMQEAVDMIAVKLSRIFSGDAYELDHWRDIAGYALLVSDTLELFKEQAEHSQPCTKAEGVKTQA